MYLPTVFRNLELSCLVLLRMRKHGTPVGGCFFRQRGPVLSWRADAEDGVGQSFQDGQEQVVQGARDGKNRPGVPQDYQDSDGPHNHPKEGEPKRARRWPCGMLKEITRK